MGDVWGQELDFRPFGDEVGESLRFNSSVGDIPNVVAHELESPLGDSVGGVAVMNDLLEWVRGDDHDLMVGEVVRELPSRHQHGVQKLLNLGVANFGIGDERVEMATRGG